MIHCNINITNNTACKAKISKDVSDNQCPKCEYFLCKKHLPRHKCVQKQQTEVKQPESNEEKKEEENQNIVQVQEQTHKQQNQTEIKIEEEEQSEPPKKKNLLHQIVYSTDNEAKGVISKEVTYEKHMTWDQESKQNQNKSKYEQSQRRELEHDYIINPNQDDENNNKVNKKNIGGYYIEEEYPEIEQKQQQQIPIPKTKEEIEIQLKAKLMQLKKNYQDYLTHGGQEQNQQQNEQQQQQEGNEEQKQEQEQQEEEQYQQLDEDRYIQENDSKTLFAAYEHQNEENRKALEEYSEILKKELQEQVEIEPLQDFKKQIFDSIDKQIILNNEKLKNSEFTEISYPEKTIDQYNFKSVNQENKYKKILPLQSMFPGEPYQLQQDFIYKLLYALDSPQEENILIESPSGTGKTLSILSAVLSFLKKHRETQTSGYRYQIIYASRTYQQLQQVSNEIKKSGYDLRCTIMGSQQEMCVNAETLRQFFTSIKKNKGSQNFGLYCQTACRSKKCKAQENSNKQIYENSEKRQILDIEEIDRQTQNFNNQSTCPYFDCRNNIDVQDLILVPYDLILNERGIKRLGKIPRRMLIIFDEAHNVLEEACNGSSYRLDMQTLEKVLDYVIQLKSDTSTFINDIQQAQKQQEYYKQFRMAQIQQLEYNLRNAQILGYDQFQIGQLQLDLHNLQNNSMEQFQQQQLEKMTKTVESINTIEEILGLTQKNFQYELSKFHQKKSEKYTLAETYPKIIQKLFSREEDEIKLIKLLKSLKIVRDYGYLIKQSSSTNQSLAQMAPIEDVIFFFHSLLLSVKEHSKYYKLMAHFSEQGYLNEPVKNLELILQCFEPELSLKRLLKFPNSHFILTSSTMTPFESFLKIKKQEFSKLKHLKSMPFKTHLFKNHVIDNQNFFGRILNISPQMEGKKKKKWQCIECKFFNFPEKTECQQCNKSKPSWLKFTRKNTDSHEKGRVISKDGQKLFEEIGLYLEKLVPAIPGGIILVFPSLNLLEKCRYAWFLGSHFGAEIEKHTKVFFQPRKKHEYRNVIADYKEHIIKNNKAMLLAVSQTDFLDSFEIKDSLSRALFIIGKPGMDISDGYVEAKMQYLESQKQNGKGNMDKWHWFNDYSIREINKAIGKVIRHKDDYGCVYLIDDVFNTSGWIVERISEWARGSIKKETDLDNLVEDTQKFFSQEFKEFAPIQMEKMEMKDLQQDQKDNIKSQYELDMEFLKKQMQNTQNNQPVGSTINKYGKCEQYYLKQQPPGAGKQEEEDEEEEDDDFI